MQAIHSFLSLMTLMIGIPFPLNADPEYSQTINALLEGEVMAVAYSGFREGQHPDRGNGSVNPSEAEVQQDLEILVAAGFRLIRLYDSGRNSELTLEVIRKQELPVKVLLGAWLDAEVSNHEGCAWLTDPIPEQKLATNTLKNEKEIERTIRLANQFKDIVVAVNVGNEALVEWNDHMVTVESVITYVRKVKGAIAQAVTVADNYAWWIDHGAALAKELDFIGVHAYPVWENKTIDDGMDFTNANIAGVHAALPNSQIVIMEAGWATTAIDFGERANETNQLRYFKDIEAWATSTNTTVFFFEAFDEPWKGNADSPSGAEKHWGLYFADRSPKQVMR